MKFSKLAPGLYLLLTITIATLLGLAEPTMAVTDNTTAIAATPTPIAHVELDRVLHPQNPLSQVSGDLAAVWTNHGVSALGVVTTASTHNRLKDLPGCSCPTCSGIIQDALLQVG